MRDKKVKPLEIPHNDIVLVPKTNSQDGVCSWCENEIKVKIFMVNTWAMWTKHEELKLCRMCEVQARKVSKGALLFDKRWIEPIKEMRRKLIGRSSTVEDECEGTVASDNRSSEIFK